MSTSVARRSICGNSRCSADDARTGAWRLRRRITNIVHFLTTLDARFSGRRLGFTCHTGDLSWDELIEWVQAGESLGYSAFCTTEESGKDAFAVLAVLARETR